MQEKKKKKKGKISKAQQISDYAFNFKPGDAFFYKIHPVSKVIWFILITYIVLIQDSLILLSIIFIIITLFSKSNRIGFLEVFKKIRYIIFMVLIMILFNILFDANIFGAHEVLFYLWYPFIPIRRLVVYFALRTAIWVLTLSTTGLIFLTTTAPKDLVMGLRKMKLSYKIAYSMMVGLRYIPLIQDNTNAVILAQKARGLDRSNLRSVRRAWELVKDRLSTTMVLVFRNANATSISMELRGFGRYKDRTDLYKLSFSIKDKIFICVLIALSIFLTLYRFHLLPFIPSMPSIYHLFWG